MAQNVQVFVEPIVSVYKWFKEACKEFRIQGQLSVVEQPPDTWDPHRYRVQNDNCTLDRIRGNHHPDTFTLLFSH